MTQAKGKARGKQELAPIALGDEKFDHDYYAEVARRADLVDVRLIENNFDVKPEFYSEISEGDCKFSFGGEASNPTFLEEEGIAGATFTWEASAKKGQKKLLKVKCVFFVMYENLEGMRPDYSIAYVYKVGRFTTYPYFRSIAAMLYANAHAEMPVLPSLKERVD